RHRRDAVDVDQPRRPRETKVHQRDQALPSCQHLAVVAVARQQVERLVQALRIVVLELRRFHAVASSTTRCGLSGSRVTSQPNASETAFAMAARTPAVPPSPAPLTPRGFRGEGAFSVMRTSMSG